MMYKYHSVCKETNFLWNDCDTLAFFHEYCISKLSTLNFEPTLNSQLSTLNFELTLNSKPSTLN